MTADIAQVAGTYRRLKGLATARDGRMSDVAAVRAGNMDLIFPGHFSDEYPKAIVANFVDVVARDLAEVIAPLPAFNCTSSQITTDRAKARAARRTKIAHWYVQHSRLEEKMFSGADQYLTYGFLPFYVEPDFEAKSPRIMVEDPMGVYYQKDRYDRVTIYCKRWNRTAGEIAEEWPEYRSQILGRDQYGQAGSPSAMLEIVRYCDDDDIILFLPERKNLTLAHVPNRLGRCPVEIAERPGLATEVRGQFDDVLWVQLARAKMALLQLEAATEAVQAPIAVPKDVQDFTFGPNSVLRSDSPDKIRRVGMEIPQGAFAEIQQLDMEQHMGARYPEGRQGQVQGSIVTGRGVQELLGGFDTQVKTAQVIFAAVLRRVVRMCFEADEKYFASDTKSAVGVALNVPFEFEYRPDRDIAGDHTCDVVYGFAAGLDPNRAIVLLLQLRGDKAISREMLQRELPFDVDLVQLAEQIDIEEMQDALKQGVFAYVQSLGVLAEQGQDPQPILQKVALMISAREKGQSLQAAVLAAFTPAPANPEEANEPAGDQAGGAGANGEPPLGIQPSGLPQGTAPGQAGQGPGGRPSLQMMLAGLSNSGQPQLQANVARRVPVQGG